MFSIDVTILVSSNKRFTNERSLSQLFLWNSFEICQIRRWIFDCNTQRLREYNVWSRMMAVIQVYCPWFCPLVRPICPHCWQFVGIVDEQSRGVYCSSDWRPQSQTAGQFPRNFHRTCLSLGKNQFVEKENIGKKFFDYSSLVVLDSWIWILFSPVALAKIMALS